MRGFRSLLTYHIGGLCPLSGVQLAALESHYELLIRWNKRMNLTSLRDEEQIVVRHYCESLFAATQLPEDRVSIVDVGSGAGFPGYPIGVFGAGNQVTLVESGSRKCVFLREAARDVANIQILEERAEAIEARYDWVVSRAVNWTRLLPAIEKLGRRVALLVSEADVVRLMELPSITWQSKVQIPWGLRRIVLIGEVSRETSETGT